MCAGKSRATMVTVAHIAMACHVAGGAVGDAAWRRNRPGMASKGDQRSGGGAVRARSRAEQAIWRTCHGLPDFDVGWSGVG